MTDIDHAETYEQRVQAIQQANEPILQGFETWLRQSGRSRANHQNACGQHALVLPLFASVCLFPTPT
jgi:hypothetical protein